MEEQADLIGNLLIEEGLITQEDLEEAAGDSAVQAAGLSSSLRRAVCVRRSELAAFVGADYQFVQVPDISAVKTSPQALATVDAETAAKIGVLPVAKTTSILFVICSDPTPEKVRNLRMRTGLRIKMLSAPKEALSAAISARYRGESAVRKPAAAAPPAAAPKASGVKAAATRVTPEEQAAYDLYMRLLTEWENTYTEGRAVQAIRVA